VEGLRSLVGGLESGYGPVYEKLSEITNENVNNRRVSLLNCDSSVYEP